LPPETKAGLLSQEQKTEPPLTAEMIAKRVQTEAGILTDKAYRVICDVVRRDLSVGEAPDDIVNQMVTMWKKLQQNNSKLEYAWGAEKFFGEGHFRSSEQWPWKEGQKPKPPVRNMPTNGELMGR
jgi:hypothetical protein